MEDSYGDFRVGCVDFMFASGGVLEGEVHVGLSGEEVEFSY